jgi:hypothetical protein
MRGDIVYHVYGLHAGREKDSFIAAFRTHSEAEAEIKKLKTREMHGKNWARPCHNRGFVVREVVVDTDFEIPLLPKQRDKYVIIATPTNQPGTWPTTLVEVYRRHGPSDLEQICAYERRYSMLETFEPFRQGNRDFALISREYTLTAVLDLQTGKVIAEEPNEPGGFCPVGFYVPDWWDVHHRYSIIPGSEYWSIDWEWPIGDFGFVWGCYWGDDSSWKVQYLDLSRVQEGVIDRQERFGYVELATEGFKNPCLTPDEPATEKSDPPTFIRLSRENGVARLTFEVEMDFDLNSGKPAYWQPLYK